MRYRGLLILAFALMGCPGSAPVVVDRVPAGGTDVTFFVAADTHFGFENIAALNKAQIAAMNSLPGTAYPRRIGGTVDEPRGVLIAGDLTERGTSGQFKEFVAHYGLTGADALLKYPVYEATGNHDRDMILLRPVLAGVRRRHGSLTYSWDCSDVHVVCLDLYPGAGNLRWLKRDLAAVGRKLPVVIYFHYSILGPFSDWWRDREKRAFARALANYNVVGIFHGHFHGSGHYRWAGRDVYNVGSPRHGGHSFAVVRITDTTMTVASWNWDFNRWQWAHSKRINRRQPGRAESGTTKQKTPQRVSRAAAGPDEGPGTGKHNALPGR